MDSLKAYNNNNGVALLIALLMSVAIMALVAGALYFITQSTTMSGAGKRYATAAEASDGAVEVMKNSIYLVFHGNAAPNVFTDPGNCLTNAIQQCTGQDPCQGSLCTVTINLPGTVGGYTATVTVQRLYTVAIPGGRLEFAKSAGGAPSTAIFYRITTSVTGPDNTTADNAALYRLTD